MTPPLAAIYDIVFGAHQISGFLLLLGALLITVLAVLSRSQEGLFAHALVIIKLSGPLFVLVVVTGIYQVIDLGAALFQSWIIGAFLLGVGFIGLLHGYWRPQAERIERGEVPRGKLKQVCNELAGGGIAAFAMMLAAIYLMEANLA